MAGRFYAPVIPEYRAGRTYYKVGLIGAVAVGVVRGFIIGTCYIATAAVIIAGVLSVGTGVIEGLVSSVLVGVWAVEELIYGSATKEAEAGDDRA